MGVDLNANASGAAPGMLADRALGRDADRAVDFGNMPPPANVETVLWNLSSPVERQALLAQAPAETCTVEVRYNPVALGASHAFIVTTDSNSQNYFRGGPSGDGPSSGPSGQLGSASGGSSGGSSRSGSSDGSDSSNGSSAGSGRGGPDRNNGPWGPIVTDMGAYRRGTIDWNPDAQRQVVEVRTGSCDAREAVFADTARRVQDAVIPYNPLSSNSNATARTIIESAGIWATPDAFVPGWVTQLPIGR